MPKPKKQLRSSKSQPLATAAITRIEYSGLQTAFDFFNVALFDGKLANAFITYQRKPHSAGYFAPDRFAGRIEQGKLPEIALNPDSFFGESDQAACQTLVHEMCHGWQHLFGKPSRGGYHNREWASKMKSIGLMPSATGKPGGREVGQHMSDYAIPDGAFVRAFAKLERKGWRLNLESAMRPGSQVKGPSSKTKFSCPSCQANAWGKPDLAISCIPCGARMMSIAPDAPASRSYEQQAA